MSQEQTQRPHLVTKAELIKDVLRITREEDARDRRGRGSCPGCSGRSLRCTTGCRG